jgi:hypothetical protein
MKKILCAFVISFLPLTSVAENLNFFSNQFHESSEDAKGHSIAIDSILSEGRYSAGIQRVQQESEINNVDSYATSISTDLALDSFIEGSAFIGLSYLNVSNEGAFGSSNQGLLRVGYAKINGEGIDYKVYFQTWDENVDSLLGIMLRGPLLGDSLNWTVGYVRNLEIGQGDLSGGLSFRF